MLKLKFLRIFLFLAFIASYELLVTSCELYAQQKIVAIVNNDVITQRDLDEFINFMRLQLAKDYNEKQIESKIKTMKLDLLDKLIEDHLILQEASKEKTKIDESRIKAKIDEIKRHYRSEVEFEQDLYRQGLTQSDIEKKVREQLLMHNIIQSKIRSKIVIRPEEITAYYSSNVEQFITPERREVQTITCENADLAKTIALNLRAGQKLEGVSAKYPVSVNKIEVGEKGELRKDIEETVFGLSAGGISDPVKVDDKYVIFSLVELIPSQQQSLQDVQDEIQEFLFDKKMQTELAKWVDELKTKSYVKILQN